MGNSRIVQLNNVRFAYGDIVALDKVNLEINRGDFVWIVGPNGGGKTTLIKIIIGLLEPDDGTVQVFGEKPSKARKKIGYMPQAVNLDPKFPITVNDVALMGRLGNGNKTRYNQSDYDAADKALDMVGIIDLKDRPYSSLSGGQLRRLLIARALSCQPELLILDEPTANLDLVVARELLELLNNLSPEITIVMVSHDPAFVSENVKEVLCVNRRAHFHPTTEIDSAFLSELYAGELRMVRHDRHLSDEVHD